MNRTSFRSSLLPFISRKALCRVLLFVLCGLMLSACGKQEPDPYGGAESIWRFASSAIILNVKSSDELNLYRKKSHTLAVCAYQLSNDRGFNEMLRSDVGMEQLVQCGRFDDSVVNYEQVFFTPGSARTITMDRREGTKLFALVGGYYDSKSGDSHRMTRIPVVEVSDSWVPLVGGKRKEAGKLILDVYLDKTSMSVVEAKGQGR